MKTPLCGRCTAAPAHIHTAAPRAALRSSKRNCGAFSFPNQKATSDRTHTQEAPHLPDSPLISRTPSTVLTASGLITAEVSTSPDPVQSTMSSTLGEPSGHTYLEVQGDPQTRQGKQRQDKSRQDRKSQEKSRKVQKSRGKSRKVNSRQDKTRYLAISG